MALIDERISREGGFSVDCGLIEVVDSTAFDIADVYSVLSRRLTKLTATCQGRRIFHRFLVACGSPWTDQSLIG